MELRVRELTVCRDADRSCAAADRVIEIECDRRRSRRVARASARAILTAGERREASLRRRAFVPAWGGLAVEQPG
jgi:hypothetical protein